MEPKSLLWTLVLAMAPVSELRGAIPYGLAHDIPLGLLLPLCVAANLLPRKLPELSCIPQARSPAARRHDRRARARWSARA